MLDEVFAGQRGEGATLNGLALRVSQVEDIRQSVVELGWSASVPYDRYAKVAERLNGLGAGVKRRGSGALGLVYVAMGRQDAYCELHNNAGDASAPRLVVEGAGGGANDLLTQKSFNKGHPVIALTPQLPTRLGSPHD